MLSEAQTDSCLILGLDLGTASVGWALLRADADGEPAELVGLGVRRFQEVVEPKSSELKNLKRRMMRGMRRNLARRQTRRDALLRELQALGLVATTDAPYAQSSLCPYELRARALTEPLSPEDLGRALFHLGKRRGFRSNRGAKLALLTADPEVQALLANDTEPGEDGKKDEDTGKLLKEIASLREGLGDRTLGQYLQAEIAAGRRARKLHYDRAMIEDEFDRIWAAQAAHHPGLTQEARARVHAAIFHQRPLKVQRFTVAQCALEPRHKVADKAQLVAQEFRIWNEVSNLRLAVAGGEQRPLTPEERTSLAQALMGQASMSWPGVRKLLRVKGSFNLEPEQSAGLKGNLTAARIARRMGEDAWNALGPAGQRELVEWILTNRDRGTLYRLLRRKGYAPPAAYGLATVELPQGTAALSARAMGRILVPLREGKDKTQAQKEAGYLRRDEITVERRDALPELPERKDLPNPRVRKALGQVRQVVNALIREHGPIHTVRVEMAREMKLSQDQMEKANKARDFSRRANERAREAYRQQGTEEPKRAELVWYRLAEECGWVCPYSGHSIPAADLGRAQELFEIEHIIPYSLLPSDEFSGLTLCHRDWNGRKGNRLPAEAFSGPEYDAMLVRVDQFKGFGTGRKKKLFRARREGLKELDEFLNRQLNETGHIARLAADYLRHVAEDVTVTRGGVTAILRERWALHSLYGEPGKRREDLRHHAADALAVAFTSRAIYGRIVAEAGRLKGSPLTNRRTVPEAPAWLHPQAKLQLDGMVVSHEPTRSIRGALHKETGYGRRGDTYHLRVPVAKLRLKDLPDLTLYSPDLARRLGDALRAHGDNPEQAFPGGVFTFSDRKGKERRVVKVRKRTTEIMKSTAQVAVNEGAKFFPLGSNHHVEVFEETATGKRFGRFVTMLEAARRVRAGAKSPVDATPDRTGTRFLWALHGNDVVQFEDGLYRVASLDPASNRLWTYRQEHGAAENDARRFLTLSRRDYVPVEVSPTGRIREIHPPEDGA